jgi:ATP-dependent HslUV protease subunit HslV
MIVADEAQTFTLTGNGDVLECNDGIVAIGSGGHFALGKRVLTVQPQPPP